MAGRHPFEKLRERMTPKARDEAEAEARRLDDESDLAELRRAVKLSQDEIGHGLQITPGSVAEIEERADMYLSTVRRFIEEIGGRAGNRREVRRTQRDDRYLRRAAREG